MGKLRVSYNVTTIRAVPRLRRLVVCLSPRRPGGIFGGQSGIGTGLSPSSSALPCQYNSKVALHIHISTGG
jgi:hypothetical protein